MDSTQVTAEDQAWFHEPVSVVVEQDNRAWLDTMLEMKKEELVNYGVFQYAIPEAAAEAVGRNDLIQMIVVANKAGGGASVSNQSYIYIKELKGILEPAVSLFNEKDDPLFLVRGEGNGQQVYDKVADKWYNLAEYRKQHAQKTADDRQVASEAAASVAEHPKFESQPAPVADAAPTAPVAPVKPTLSDSVVSILPTLKRADLAKFAKDLGIEDGESTEVYGSNKILIEKITEVNEANKGE